MINVVYGVCLFFNLLTQLAFPVHHWEAKPLLVCFTSVEKEKDFFLRWIFCKFRLSPEEKQGIIDLPGELSYNFLLLFFFFPIYHTA